jgi:IrrE N-terminal-like domain
MISAEQAAEFARLHFPNAPERLAQHLSVEIRESPMDGCDGWCLTVGQSTIIRLNSTLSATRKRFTLAHELGHLILGVPALVGESFEDMLGSDSAEERRVNDLASELLIPTDVIKSTIPDLPVVAAALRRLAKKANVSELAAAIRVCNLAKEIGLKNASVVLFDDGEVRWQWSKTLSMPNETATRLLEDARQSAPEAYRYTRPKGDVIVASTIENPYFGSATLFVQLLPAEIGLNRSHHERRGDLERVLFANNTKLQQQLSGLLGAHKQRIVGMSVQEAVESFWERNKEKLRGTSIGSKEGREYVKLRIGEWF